MSKRPKILRKGLPPSTCHVSHVTCHVSHVMRHMSCITCHVSHVMCHMSCVMCHITHNTCQINYFFYKLVKLVAGGYVINRATPSSFLVYTYWELHQHFMKRQNHKSLQWTKLLFGPTYIRLQASWSIQKKKAGTKLTVLMWCQIFDGKSKTPYSGDFRRRTRPVDKISRKQKKIPHTGDTESLDRC